MEAGLNISNANRSKDSAPLIGKKPFSCLEYIKGVVSTSLETGLKRRWGGLRKGNEYGTGLTIGCLVGDFLVILPW